MPRSGSLSRPARAATDAWRPLLDALPTAILIVGTGGTIHFANRQLEELTGYACGELEGQPVEVLVPESLRVCRRADGTTFPAEIRLSPLPIGERRYVVATVSDESDRIRTEEELFRRAVHDPLTGLPNRVLLLDRLEQALARAGRKSHRLAVLYVDLDGFKAVNDTWGHAVGDVVLQTIGARLAEAIRPEDTVARFGGDEFVVMCEGFEGAAEATDLAARILAAIGRPVPHGRGVATVGASIGVVLADGHRSGAALVDEADRAMYRAKRRGGSSVEVSSPDGPGPPAARS